MLKKFIYRSVSGLVLLLMFFGTSFAQGMDYFDFLLAMEVDTGYEKELLGSAGDMTLNERWKIIKSGESDKSKAGQSYAMMVDLLAQNELEDLDNIKGFVTESDFLKELSFSDDPGISRQLLVLQSALVSFASLCRTKEPAALSMARDVFLSLQKTRIFEDISSLSRDEHEMISDHFSTTRNIYEKVYKGNFT